MAATDRPPGVETSVWVTYMSAHEQSRTLEAIAMRDFILFSAGAPAFSRQRRAIFALSDATLVPFYGENRCRPGIGQLARHLRRPRPTNQQPHNKIGEQRGRHSYKQRPD